VPLNKTGRSEQSFSSVHTVEEMQVLTVFILFITTLLSVTMTQQKKKVLIITQEMEPYTALSEISQIVYRLPLYLNTNNCELRILMPRFGTINERRHRLHEVVRLSGMNIIVNDDDYPLIIKVASMPNSRIQVYFLDNDEFFKRKSVFDDADGKPFEDNADRAVFFSKGAIETVRKFGWPPDIIHCHGWMTSMVPFYLRTSYKNDPLFQSSKIVYSLYDTLQQTFTYDDFAAKASINNLEEDDLLDFKSDIEADLHKGAILHADGIIKSGVVSATIENQIAKLDVPVLESPEITEGQDLKEVLQTYLEFYQNLEPVEA
jgi:starch synthase